MSEDKKIMVASEEMIGGCLTEDQSGGLERLADEALAEALASGAAYYDETRASSGPRPQYLADMWNGSPNVSSRNGRRVRRIIIHTMQGSFQSAVSWFAQRVSQVSAHYSVGNAGQSTQHVGEASAAWHAGNSIWNQETVGIEHEGYVDDGKRPTDAMYNESARVSAGICHRHKLSVNRDTFKGHWEVPDMVSVRTDPGKEWDWNKYLRLVKHYLAGGADPKPEPEEPEEPKEPKGTMTRIVLLEGKDKGDQVFAGSASGGDRAIRTLKDYGIKAGRSGKA